MQYEIEQKKDVTQFVYGFTDQGQPTVDGELVHELLDAGLTLEKRDDRLFAIWWVPA